jgi:hypothetical protein
MKIKVKFPDHGARVARFLARLPPRVRAESFRKHGVASVQQPTSYRHIRETQKGRPKPGDENLETQV